MVFGFLMIFRMPDCIKLVLFPVALKELSRHSYIT